MDVRSRFVALFAALVFVVGIGSAHAAEKYTSHQTATAEITAGSREGIQVREWLQRLNAPSAPGVSLSFATGDRITVTRTSTSESSGRMTASSINNPPVPLPASGSSGETITIEHTSGVWFQSWTYQWSGNSTGGAWGLISYRIERVKVGPAPY